MIPSTAAAFLTLTAGTAFAHIGCGGQEIGRRNVGGPMLHSRAVTDEASAAVSTDVSTECTAYGYAPVTQIASSFPAIWQTASILSTDSEAQQLFASINATVNSKLPNDVPHGTPTGNWTGVSYSSSDPDCWWTHNKCTTPSSDTGLKADITTVPEPMTWGLGFDDGPNCSHNALYDLLLENNQKATMFYIGSNVMDWPLQAMRAHDEGHEICVHTWSHQYMTALSNEVVFAELYYTQKAIKAVLGVTPLCWRPPYGDVDNRVRMIAAALNLSTIVWSDDTNDWEAGTNGVTQQDVTNNYQSVIDKAGNGTYTTHGPVVLNHELTNYTMSVFVSMFPKIKSAFSYIVPICTAYNITQPYAESNVTCPNFETYISGVTNISTSTTQKDGSSSTNTSYTASGSTSPSASSTGKSDDSSSSGSASSSTAANSASSAKSGALGMYDGLSGMGLILGGVVAGVMLL
ncbi:chitin deacetylase 2 [Cryptococcus deuterogattii 99/473]|uniref:chitin deacetylase n=1 Tax=Cryptococcus deuterogattii Ram5 TaxID=1296110 RepID=A0A0D0V8M8_9TREE|nr:chitin deacetylase 2 [Cryptococcus deuterogattii LA55]KIR42869.1 chitin deacetylase 2 [Cryptococcus deuterogattii Ram5]KIR75606.1 chitin deacetylase 2 [Cryptococcus deuterogattii CA1014]KIR95546.1 chitin deacetylase 2 [Cryptococcus deuterogattii CBS 10090]KIY59550.1 chitin deacetylase 2 [Cryptococcus deuterogattii 99/473]KNX50205.2 chitin deacetylase 2 [Cryptococcus deuterogattii R265]